MAQDLTPGYKVVPYPRHATAGYRGVLRRTRGTKPAWTCVDHSPHPSPVLAVQCAERKLERMGEGGKEVFTLLRCAPCDRWWPDVDVAGPLACPVCGVPMERLKLVVTERGPAA